MTVKADLLGRRVLLVEDELLIAMLLEEALQDAGCVIVGPFARLAGALQAAVSEELDAALLDVNLAGEKVYPAAEALAARGVPFLLLSGYGEKALPAAHEDWICFTKPFDIEDLLEKLATLIGNSKDLPRLRA